MLNYTSRDEWEGTASTFMSLFIKKAFMKKLLLITASIVLISLSASAQISKGSSYLGGNLGFGTSKNSINANYAGGMETKSTNFYISPSIGFAYKENRVWGLSLSFTHIKDDVWNNEPDKQDAYGIGGFLRQYKPLGKSVYIFAQEALNFSYNKSNRYTSQEPGSYKGYGITASFAPGFAYDVNKRFQLEIVLNNLLYVDYNHSKATQQLSNGREQVKKESSFGLGSDLNSLAEVGTISIGARFVFGR